MDIEHEINELRLRFENLSVENLTEVQKDSIMEAIDAINAILEDTIEIESQIDQYEDSLCELKRMIEIHIQCFKVSKKNGTISLDEWKEKNESIETLINDIDNL